MRLCLVIACVLALSTPVGAQEPGYGSLPMAQAAPIMQQADPPLVLDVREPSEFAAGHVPGAVNVPLGRIGAWAEERSDLVDAPLIVICQSGRRSLRASEELAARGFRRVTNAEGGFRAWQEQGLPVERP